MGMFAETAIVVYLYCLLTKESKLPFSISIYSKQMKVSRWRFLFAANKRSCRFPLFLFSVCTIPETWRHGPRDMEKWRHGDGDMET
jgi:hypothetical protein